MMHRLMLAALLLSLAACKVGPDFIDPGHHATVTGRPGRNLDTWLLDPSALAASFRRASAGCDLAVIEGVMGLFDGAPGEAGHRGATADLAAHFNLPVVLVLDVARLVQSAAAVVRGFATHDPAVKIAGVILNRTASERSSVLRRRSVSSISRTVATASTWYLIHSGCSPSTSRSVARAPSLSPVWY